MSTFSIVKVFIFFNFLTLFTVCNGPPVRILPNIGPTMTIKACVGENKQLMTKDASAQEDIVVSQWIFRKGNASSTIDDVILCRKEISGMFMVNPLYSSKVEQCNTTSILLKNISFHEEGYYILQFLKEKIGSTESLPIFLTVSGPPVRILPNIGPTMTIKACVGENKQLMTKDASAQEDIVVSQWIFRKGNASSTIDDVILCRKEISGMFMVNPLYSSKVEQCNTTSILLKNISFHEEGYYILQFPKEKIGSTESLPIFLTVSGPPVRILPNIGPTMTIKACVGENKQLMTKDASAQEDIVVSQWIFRKGNASSTIDDVILCRKEISGMFMVNPLYSSKVEQCNTTSILLKNISFHEEGYYILQFPKEKIGSTESLPIFLTVSDTPAKQCKPVIRSHSGNMLNCSTQCEQFDVEWRLNKGGDVVGNESILLVDCLWKNKAILCCLMSKDMECYKGDRLDLCVLITPSYCTENEPRENGYNIHADKAEDAFVFTECNATLVWNLGNDSSELLVDITNPNGSSIIQMEKNQCTNRNNSSVKCIVKERDMEVFVSAIIISTTINDSGNYTALIRKGFAEMVSISKRLTVIDKPQIMVKAKPILHESFLVTCSISFIHECLNFRWKIKGTDVEYESSDNASKLKFTNLTTMDNSIKLQCKVGMEKCVDSNHAHHVCVSAESDPYIVRPYYFYLDGPYNVSFNLKDNNIYLRENETFIAKCYADCYPVCIFRWESYYMNVENEELVVNRFESTMVGPYTCIARNRETNETEKSRPVFLHHMKDFISVTTIHSNINIDDTGHREVLYWIGPAFLVVVFVILVTLWRIKASRGIEKRRKRQARAEQADSEVSRTNTWTNSRTLPCPPVQEDLFRRRNRLDYPKLQRHFMSLEKLSDQDKDVCNRTRESMFLQTLSHSSNILDRQIRDDLANAKSTSEKDNLPYSIEGSPKGSRLSKRFARSKTSGMVTKDYHETGTNSQPLISLQKIHDGSKLQEDQYNTIDENVLTVYDYSTYNALEETSQETERRPEHRMYCYASSSDIYHVEAADVHATDENYLNPISDLAHPSETCQLDETDMNGTDKKYIAIIDDFSSPVEIRQVEETNVTETDPTYITPITGSQ